MDPVVLEEWILQTYKIKKLKDILWVKNIDQKILDLI